MTIHSEGFASELFVYFSYSYFSYIANILVIFAAV